MSSSSSWVETGPCCCGCVGDPGAGADIEDFLGMNDRRTTTCSHQSTVSVVTGGLERVICEYCGDVTVRYESMISGDINRLQFSRKAEKTAAKTGAHSQP